MTQNGLSFHDVKKLQAQFGPNTVTEDHGQHRIAAFLARFKNPLVIILLIAASLSIFFGDKTSFFIITAIVLLSVVLDFVNTFKSERAAEELKEKVRVKVRVMREGKEHFVPAIDLVPGDIVLLKAGSVVPADGEMLESTDLFTNEAALTGESFPQAKPTGQPLYMGSGVVSGSGIMRVDRIGHDTKFAHIAKALQSHHRLTEFEAEIKEFSLLIVRITFFMVIFVTVVNVLFHKNPLDSILFSLALAVGLTPELLPLIITLNLTKGSLLMARHGVIVKELSAMQNFGSMDVLCTDKTGTLTEDKITLVQYVDGLGKASVEVLELGYLTSVFTTSFENPLDAAVRSFNHVNAGDYQKIDEIPFDFERKREAVVVHHTGKQQRTLIVKGAPEEVLKISTSYQNSSQTLDKTLHAKITETFNQLSRDGFRVLAVASKIIGTEKHYQPSDEQELCFNGFLAFLDPAKKTVSDTLKLMQEMNVGIKIITGDNAFVTEKIAHDINLKIEGTLTGSEIAALTKRELATKVEKTTIFARVNPEQKMQIIEALQENGHVVGFMGDGINDAPSLRAADVGVSVNNAVDVAKDAADFILLRKSLHELIEGVAEGRKTFANTLKYLRMGLSSNFGNMFSMAGASLFLPFLPMLATQILLNNLLYDTSQFAIPLDNVDKDDILKPRTLNIRRLKRFMWAYGLLSSVFDYITFGLLLFVFRADASLFQASWFYESILTQVFVVFIIRTARPPISGSKPAKSLIFSTTLIGIAATIIVATPVRNIFHFSPLQPWQIGALMAIVLIYLLSAELLKNILNRLPIPDKARV